MAELIQKFFGQATENGSLAGDAKAWFVYIFIFWGFIALYAISINKMRKNEKERKDKMREEHNADEMTAEMLGNEMYPASDRLMKEEDFMKSEVEDFEDLMAEKNDPHKEPEPEDPNQSYKDWLSKK